jgi:riboflavin synthase
MFTGIVEDIGSVRIIRKLPGKWEFLVSTRLDPKGIHDGDSIAVDGVCLTVTRIEGTDIIADASLETLAVTTLKDKTPGDRVNLEQAMRADSRFGGHMVLGHVDGIGRVAAIDAAGDSIRLEIEVPHEVIQYIVKKGSVAIDGTSLTVNDLHDRRFALNIIPFSSSRTTLGSKGVGDHVNVETDVVARYVEKFVSPREREGVDLDFLYNYGYIKGR